MANNKNINQVIYGTSTLIDLTNDTITPERMYKGIKAHMADGSTTTGTAEVTVENTRLIMPEGFIGLVSSTSDEHTPIPEAIVVSKTITHDGTYYAASDNADGYNPIVVNVGGGGSGTNVWGEITGTLTDQTDLDDALDGKVSTSGDTMTGDLIITETPNVNLKMKNTSMDYTRTTSGSQAQSIVRFLDYQENTAGAFQILQTPDGHMQSEFTVQKKYNNNTYTNKLVLRVKNTGTYEVEVTAPSAWRSALGLTSMATASDSGWKSLTNSSKFSGTIYYRKIGSMVEVNVSATLVASRDSSDWTELTTIPSGYRPAKEELVAFTSRVAQNHRGWVRMNPDGGGISVTAENGCTIGTTASITCTLFYFT